MTELSPRAQKLYARLLKGEWYAWCAKRTPKAMQELADAGLVVTRGRVKVVEVCWVAKAWQDPNELAFNK